MKNSTEEYFSLLNEIFVLLFLQGIDQMDTSIAAVAAFNPEATFPEADPFDTSFVLGPKRVN